MRLVCFVCGCILVNAITIAQNTDYNLTNPDYYVERIPTSPEVAQLGTYGNLPVDQFTGTANVNIPIHQIDFQGISIPIELTYNTGGIRVSQEATWVGLGWNLNANAVISRKINGFDDLVDGGNSGPNLKSQGYIYSSNATINANAPYEMLSASDSVMLGSAWKQGRVLDMEPDVFTVSLFGRSYSFTLSKWDGNSAFILGINHDNAELIVRYYVNEQRFEIVDAHGFIYYFDSKERSDPYRSQGSPYYGTANITTEELARDQVGVIPIDLSKVRNAIMSFHLDQIVSPLGRELYFEYEDGLHFTYPDYFHSIAINPNEGTIAQPVYDYRGNVGGGFSVNCNITLIKKKYLKRIYGDFGDIAFELEERDDLYNWEIHDEITGFAHPNALPNASLATIYATKQRRLSNIIVTNRANQQIKLVDLHYSYFNSDRVSDAEPERYLRLKLDKVAIDDRVYHFDYLYENSLPAKDSPSTDFWGFYNGEANLGNNHKMRIPSFGRYVTARINANPQESEKYIIYEGATRSSNFDYGKVGLLKTVYHPTKGRTEFEYEGNRASVQKPFSQNNSTIFSNSSDYKYNYQYLERAELQKLGGATINGVFTIQGAGSVPGDNVVVRVDISCGNYGQGSGNCSTGNPLDLIFITNLNNPSEIYSLITTNGLSYDSQSSLNGSLSLPNGTYSLSINPQANPIGISVSITEAYIIDVPPNNGDTFREYEVGGARIKSISDYGADGTFVSKRVYDYQESGGFQRSSGMLMNELIFHSKNGYFDYSPQGYNENQLNLNSSNLLNGPGNHVSYTQVNEQLVDSLGNHNGSKKTIFYNQRNQHVLRAVGLVPEYGWYNYNNNIGGNTFVSYGDVYYLGLNPNSNNHLNGKISKETIYNEDGNPVNESQNFYSTHEIGVIDALKVYYSGSSLAPVDKYAIYPMYQRVALLDSTVTRQYFKENTPTPEIVEIVTTHQYQSKDSYGLFRHFWPTHIATTNSKGETVSQDIVYSTESGLPYMDDMVNLNRRAKPVEVRGYRQGAFLGHTITEYGYDAQSGILSPKIIHTKKGATLEESRISLELYDEFGNLLQYRMGDGTPVSYLYGYGNKMHVVAKIQNAEWNAVSGILSNDENSELLDSTTSDTRMRELLDKIRTAPSMSEAFVTTFTYKQGVGISSMTDSRGYTTTYGYDSSQRLEKVRDADGNILSDNQYGYKTATQD